MRWWFQRKKVKTIERDVTINPPGRTRVSYQNISLPSGETLVLLRRAWEHYVELRDGLPGIVQITTNGFNDIASMVSIMINDNTIRPIIYSSNQSNPNILKVGSERVGEINVSLGLDGLSFSHADKDYFTDEASATGNMLGVLNSLWPDRHFLFTFGWACLELNNQRTEFYLSGLNSVPNGFDGVLAMTWYDGSDTSPDLHIIMENGVVYAVAWVSGKKGPQLTRIQ
jgi:hypothetical protein